jgi:hypothetical protein
MMSEDLALESVWQVLTFHLPIPRHGFPMFYMMFTDGGKKSYELISVDGESIGVVEESLLDYIVSITNEKYSILEDRVRAELKKISDMKRKVVDKENKDGAFKEIKLNLGMPDYGLKDGDTFEGWILPK